MLTDWCTVDLVGEDGRVRLASWSRTAIPRRSRWPANCATGFPSDLGARRLGTEVIRTGRPVLVRGRRPTRRSRRRSAIARVAGRDARARMPVADGRPADGRESRARRARRSCPTESGRRYTRSDLAFAEELARHAAVAVDNARLHQAEQIQRQAIERLQAITAGLSKAMTPADVAAVVIDQALPAIGASAGLVSLLSADGTTLEAIRDIGLGEALGRRWQRIEVEDRRDADPATSCATDRRCFSSRSTSWPTGYSGILRRRSALPVGARAVLPLQTAGAPFGVMLFLFPTPLEFTERDRALLLAIARQCAQALDRARLYAHEHRVAETLQHALLPVDAAGGPRAARARDVRAGEPRAPRSAGIGTTRFGCRTAASRS